MIGFWISTPRKFSYKDIGVKGFGGAENSAFNLAYELFKLGFDTHVFGDLEEDFENFHPRNKLKNFDLDVLITVRADNQALNPRYNHQFVGNVKKHVLWTGDEHTQPNNEIFHDSFSLKVINKIICKSQWQKKDLLKYYPLLSDEKVDVIYNGTHIPDDLNIIRDKPRFICASTVYRGIWNFLDIWPLILKEIPDAELDLYCKKSLYIKDSDESRFEDLYKDLQEIGINLKDPVPQKELHRRFKNYFAMLYPNEGFKESSCGVVLQAMAHGLPVISSNTAGLKETLSMGNGYQIEFNDRTDFIKDFVNTVWHIWENKEDTWSYAEQGVKKLEEYSWKKVALKWKDFIEHLMMHFL